MTVITMNHGQASNGSHTAVTAEPGTASGTASGAAAGALKGALAPLCLQVKIGEMLGYAFGRVVGLPVGVVCKGVIGLANKFRSPGNQLPSKSINQYSIKIAKSGSWLGTGVALFSAGITWPLLLTIAPFTAAAGAVIGGACGYLGSINKVAQGSHDDSRRGAEHQDNLSLDDNDYHDQDPGSIDVESDYEGDHEFRCCFDYESNNESNNESDYEGDHEFRDWFDYESINESDYEGDHEFRDWFDYESINESINGYDYEADYESGYESDS